MPRTDEIVTYVASQKNWIWDSYDQGRWAHSVGITRDSNPHLMPGQPDYFHTNMADWYRGWDAEASRGQVAK